MSENTPVIKTFEELHETVKLIEDQNNRTALILQHKSIVQARIEEFNDTRTEIATLLSVEEAFVILNFKWKEPKVITQFVNRPPRKMD